MSPPWTLPPIEPPEWLRRMSPAPAAPSGVATGPSGPPDASHAGRFVGPPANTSAQRTSEREISPYADYGVTASGDSVFAGAAAIKGRDAKTGVEAEAFSVSGQLGMQSEAQAAMARVGWSSDDGRQNASMDIFTARANAGVYNTDGSVGLNLGASATAVGVEGTANYSGWSLTGGLAVSAGAEGHVGIRDSDKDGSKELSIRVSVMFFTVGVGLEWPF